MEDFDELIKLHTTTLVMLERALSAFEAFEEGSARELDVMLFAEQAIGNKVREHMRAILSDPVL